MDMPGFDGIPEDSIDVLPVKSEFLLPEPLHDELKRSGSPHIYQKLSLD
jgi:hypothetical protein